MFLRSLKGLLLRITILVYRFSFPTFVAFLGILCSVNYDISYIAWCLPKFIISYSFSPVWVFWCTMRCIFLLMAFPLSALIGFFSYINSSRTMSSHLQMKVSCIYCFLALSLSINSLLCSESWLLVENLSTVFTFLWFSPLWTLWFRIWIIS